MSEEKITLFCSHCGSEQNTQAKFCTDCGHKLEKELSTEFKAEEPMAAEVLLNDSEQQAENMPPEAQESSAESGAATQPGVRLTKDAVPEELPPEAEPSEAAAPEELPPAPTYTAIPTEVIRTDNKYYSAGQQGYQEPAPAPAPTGNGYIGFSIASMVCGIFSIICCCISGVSILLGIAAIILGIVSLSNKYDGRGMAIAGIVLGAVCLVLFVLAIALGLFTGLFAMIDTNGVY